MAMSTMFVGGNQNTGSMYAGQNPSSTSLTSRPTVINQTLGWQSNYTVPYAYRIMRWRGGYENSILNGQLVFLRQRNDDLDGKQFIRGSANNLPSNYPGRREVTTMVNLPMLNYALYKDWRKFEEDLVSGVYDQDPILGKDGATQNQKDAYFLQEMILKRWSFLGTVINEGAPTSKDNGFQSVSGSSGKTEHRLINTCIRGRQTTFNIWGNIKDSDLLYIMFRKVPTAGTDFQLDCKNHGGFMPEHQNRTCYQAIPYFTNKGQKPKLCCNDRLQNQVMHFTYVGRCFRTTRGTNHDTSPDSIVPSDDAMRRVREISYQVARSVSFEILVDTMYD